MMGFIVWMIVGSIALFTILGRITGALDAGAGLDSLRNHISSGTLSTITLIRFLRCGFCLFATICVVFSSFSCF